MKKSIYPILLVCLAFLPLWVHAQQKTISGKVSDESGVPIISAIITIDKTNIATTTNINGLFNLDVPANATITISSLGYISQTIKEETIQSELIFSTPNKNIRKY